MKFYVHEEILKNHISNSGKAIYFTHTYGGFNTGSSIQWFPLSQLTIKEDFNECGYTEIDIPEWILKQKGLLGYANCLKGAFEEIDII